MSQREDFTLPNKAPELPPSHKKRQTPSNEEALHNTVLPSSVDAEKTILGAILLNEDAFYEASERINVNDFSLDSHQRIFLRMTELTKAHQAIDIVTLANELARNKEIEFIGGVAYIASLTEGLPLRPVIEDYIRIVKDKAMLRRMMTISAAVIARCSDQSETALEIAGALEVQLEDVISGGMHRKLLPVEELTIEVLNQYEQQSVLNQSPGFSWGVEGLDEATGGIQNGEQVCIGCFSGVGKTTLLAQMVVANCSKGRVAAMFLIEPTRHSFLRQIYAIVANVKYSSVTRPWTATQEERDRVRWAANEVLQWKDKVLFIMDESNLSYDEYIAQARLAIHRHEAQLIGLDYIQRLKIAAADKHEDTRLKIGRASIGTADLVKNTHCRSVILSQLNRAGGMDTLPTMNMLRESGQLENDATTILLLHLKFDAENGHFTDEGAGIVPKQRFGVPTNVKLYKDWKTAKWCSGEKPPPEDSQRTLY